MMVDRLTDSGMTDILQGIEQLEKTGSWDAGLMQSATDLLRLLFTEAMQARSKEETLRLIISKWERDCKELQDRLDTIARKMLEEFEGT